MAWRVPWLYPGLIRTNPLESGRSRSGQEAVSQSRLAAGLLYCVEEGTSRVLQYVEVQAASDRRSLIIVETSFKDRRSPAETSG